MYEKAKAHPKFASLTMIVKNYITQCDIHPESADQYAKQSLDALEMLKL